MGIQDIDQEEMVEFIAPNLSQNVQYLEFNHFISSFYKKYVK